MATMDLIYQAIKADVVSTDLDRQSSSLLVALQLAASGKDISSLAPTFCNELIANRGTSVVCKKLAYDCVRISRLIADEWEIVCRGMTTDFNAGNPDLTAVSLSFITALPSWRVGDFVTECSKDISACMVHDHVALRQVTVETLGCLLARDDMALLCATSVTLLERANFWWTQICRSMLDTADSVSSAAFDAVGSLFSEFATKRLSRLAGDKIISTESSLAVRSQFVISTVEFVWSKRDLLMARAAVLPLDKMRSTVYPLVYAARAVASGMLDDMKSFTANRKGAQPSLGGRLGVGAGVEKDLVNAERILGVSDIISHLSPFLSSSLDPALVYEVGIQVLSLAGVPGGKPEWALGPITAFLTLWDRQEYSAGREAIVRAVVSNLKLLDLHLQVALSKRLLVMVRNLRMEADRMHALACICQTALSLDLFVKESARRGQKPLAGTDVSALLEDAQTREEFSAVSADSLFREELLACLAETCFQLSQPPPPLRSPTTGMRASGVLGNTEGSAANWAQSALEVLEVGRPCMGWECAGRTYAMDCYLRLLTQLCLLYDTAGGVKSIADGATPEQIRAEQRLQNLQRQLLEDLADVATPRMRVRLLWVLAEHLSLAGTSAVFADEPREPLNVLIACIHRILFSPEAAGSDRSQDVEAILVCGQHLGTRSFRAAALVCRELEGFRTSSLADGVSKQRCKLIVSLLANIQKAPERQWAARVGPTGEYPFTHHKLSVEYHQPAAAQDRKLEDVVRTAVTALWHPGVSELEMVTGGAGGRRGGRGGEVAAPKVLSGSSDPVLTEGYHLMDVNEHRVTLHLKVLNMTEIEVGRVEVRVGLLGSLRFMDGAPQAVRQLRGLLPQEPVKADVTVTVSRFERSALCVQLLYYGGGAVSGLPPGSHISAGDYADVDETDGKIRRKKQGAVGIQGGSQGGDPVLLRCQAYRIPLTELLLPYPVAPVEFFRIVPGLPAMREFLGMYRYESNEKNIVLRPDEIGARKLLGGLRAIEKKPLHKVCQHMLRSRSGFQLCYMAKTWYGDTLAMIIFGISDIAQDGGLGDEFTDMLCKFVLRSSSQRVLDEIAAEPQDWLDDLTDGAVTVVTEEELKADLVEKQRQTTEKINFLKENMKPSNDGIPLPGYHRDPEPEPEPGAPPKVAVIPEEQQALQVAVLQQWNALRVQQTLVQNQTRTQ